MAIVDQGSRGAWTARRHDGVTALAAHLTSLGGNTRQTVFQTPDWLVPLATAIERSGRGQPFAVEVRRGGEPVLSLPLCLAREGRRRVIRFLDFGLSDYNAPILAPRAALLSADMPALRAVIGSALPPADLVAFEKMPARIGACPNPFLAFSGTAPMRLTASATPIATPFAAFASQRFEESFLRFLTTKRKRLSKKGTVRFVVQTEPDALTQGFAVMAAQRAARFGRLGAEDVLADPVWAGFYRDLIAAGRPAVMTALLCGEEPIAFIYGLVYGPTFHVIMLTFDWERFKNYSPGLLVAYDTMAWAAEKGLTMFDFTIGAESYKAQFAAAPEPVHEVQWALTAAGVAPAFVARAKAFVRTRPRVEAFVARLGVKPRQEERPPATAEMSAS